VSQGPNFPFGVAFISYKYSEEQLLAYAYAFEQATMARNTVKPYILPKTQIVPVVPTPTPTASPTNLYPDLSEITVDDIVIGYQTNAFTAVQLGMLSCCLCIVFFSSP
jgi:hypothetical protein